MTEVRKVTIVCADPRHKRGKVAIIDTLMKSGDVWVSRADARRTVEEHRRPEVPDRPIWGSRRYRRAGSQTGAGRRRYVCKLCPTSLECTEPMLLWLLNLVAAAGESRLTLSQLNALVSKRT